jgi:hypothetical protein
VSDDIISDSPGGAKPTDISDEDMRGRQQYSWRSSVFRAIITARLEIARKSSNQADIGGAVDPGTQLGSADDAIDFFFDFVKLKKERSWPSLARTSILPSAISMRKGLATTYYPNTNVQKWECCFDFLVGTPKDSLDMRWGAAAMLLHHPTQPNAGPMGEHLEMRCQVEGGTEWLSQASKAQKANYWTVFSQTVTVLHNQGSMQQAQDVLRLRALIKPSEQKWSIHGFSGEGRRDTVKNPALRYGLQDGRTDERPFKIDTHRKR